MAWRTTVRYLAAPFAERQALVHKPLFDATEQRYA